LQVSFANRASTATKSLIKFMLLNPFF